jgi:PAS domain-containing protein
VDDGTIQDLICAIDDPPVDAQKRQCVISRLKAATRSSRVRDVLISYLLRRSFELDSKLRMASAQTVILRKSLDALKSAIVLLQQNGKVIFVNATAERLIGQCPELRIEQDKFCSMRRADTLRLEQLTKEATGAGGR